MELCMLPLLVKSRNITVKDIEKKRFQMLAKAIEKNY